MNYRNVRLAAAAAVGFTTLCFATQSPAAELPLPRDGWASWEVAASDRAPAFCCWSSWDSRADNAKACELDENRQGFGARDHATTDRVRVYARFANGKVERLRTLAASCPVKTRTPIRNLDGIATDDSVRWLLTLSSRGDLDHDVPASLAVHEGALALDALKKLARDEARAETRHHALFWLAQRGSADAETVIAAALKNDPDGGVREHAVFALSVLPDGRSATALIAAAEDRSLPRELRKRALFWLAQSESEGARQYLDRILLGAAR
jgi:hypothetical protein